jgi:hypothetical protein
MNDAYRLRLKLAEGIDEGVEKLPVNKPGAEGTHNRRSKCEFASVQHTDAPRDGVLTEVYAIWELEFSKVQANDWW